MPFLTQTLMRFKTVILLLLLLLLLSFRYMHAHQNNSVSNIITQPVIILYAI